MAAPKKTKPTPRTTPTNVLERMRFTPIDPARLEKVVRLGVLREPSFVYLLPWRGGVITRAPIDPAKPVRGPDDPAEELQTFADPTNRTTHVVTLDDDGDVAQLRRRIGTSYAMDGHGRLFERAPTPSYGDALPLDADEIATVLDHLNAIAPDTYDEAGRGNFEFEAIEQTATHWLVAFNVGDEAHHVAFKTKHPLVDPDGTPKSAWLDALSKAISRWSDTTL